MVSVKIQMSRRERIDQQAPTGLSPSTIHQGSQPSSISDPYLPFDPN